MTGTEPVSSALLMETSGGQAGLDHHGLVRLETETGHKYAELPKAICPCSGDVIEQWQWPTLPVRNWEPG
jgi:hypothetical protein